MFSCTFVCKFTEMFDTPFVLGFIWDGISSFTLCSDYPNTFSEFGKKKKYFLSIMEIPFIPLFFTRVQYFGFNNFASVPR